MIKTVVAQQKWVFFVVLFLGLFAGSAVAQTTYTWIGGNGSWAVATNWSPTRTTPATSDIIQFNDGGTYTVTSIPAGGTIRQLIVTNNTNISLQMAASGSLSLGNVTTNANVLTIAAGSTLQLSSTGAVAHTLQFTNLTGSSTNIAGNLVINANTGLTNTVNFANLTAANNVITGTITNNGGVVTATAANTTFGAGSFYTHARNGGAIPTATWNATSTVNVTGITTTALTAIVAAQNFGNFTWNSSSTVATALTGAGSFTISGALNVNAGILSIGTMALAANNFTVSGTTTIASGATLSFTNVTGNRLFNGSFINNGTFTNSINEDVTFTNNFENNGTFTSGTGVYTFNGTGRTINTSVATTITSVTITGTWTNNSTAGFYVGTTFAGAGTITNGTNAILGFGGTTLATTGVNLTANTPNTFVYNGTGTQTVRAITYHNLEINKTAGSIANAAGVTVNNNLTVTSGTLSDNAGVITGNATGIFSVAAGATYQTNRTTASFFPTNFTSGNIILDNLSIFAYGTTTTSFNLPLLSTLPISQYPILGINGSGTKNLQEATTVYGLSINVASAILADNGFQITANAAGPITMASGATLSLGNASNGTTFPLNAVQANINLNVGSTVAYLSTQAQTIGSEPVYGNLALTNASTKTLNGGTTVTGTFSMGSGNPTFDANGQTLTLRGAAAYTSGTFNASATNSHVRIETFSGNFYNFGAGTPLIRKVTMANSGVATLSNSIDVEEFVIIAGSANLTVSNCTLGITGTYSNSGTISLNGGATSVLAMKGTTAQNLAIGTYTSSLVGNLVINNAAGVTLDAPVNVTTISLNNGLLNTTGTNILQVNGLTAANIVGGSSTSYVNGPMRRLLPNLASAVSFVFPVGKSGYNPFVLNSPTTTASTVVVQAEVFDAVAGGTDAAGFSSGSPAPAHYWQASATTSPANLTAIGSIRLQDSGMTITADNAVGRSATQTGVYSNFGGSNPNNPATGDLTTTITVPTALGFFKIGEKGSLCGTYTVGTGENFTTLTEAISVLNGSNITCNVVFELTNNYSGAGETFPIVFNQLSYVGGPWTVTVRPGTGVTTNRVIAGAPATGLPLINLNGADNIIFDGVPGGSTSSNVIGDSRLLLRNTQTTTPGPVVLIDNDAQNDTLEYVQIEGQNITATSGLVVFGATATSVGNDNHAILFSTLRDRTDVTGLPLQAIYSVGSSTAGRTNDNITVANCNIFNFFVAGTSGFGINVGNYNNSWTIRGNSFYQTASRASTSGVLRGAISVSPAALGGDGFTIENNIVGGSQPDGGGTAWTMTGGVAHTFVGIQLNANSAATAVPSTVSGNVVRNISQASTATTATLPSAFTGIHVGPNSYNVTVDNNQVGDTTGTGSIAITRNGSGAGVYGIAVATNGFMTITNNRVGSFTITNGTPGSQSTNFFGIHFTGGSSTTLLRNISNNVVGSRNTANNIHLTNGSFTTTTQNMYGIHNPGTGIGATTISGNIVANLTNAYTVAGTNAVNHGISVGTGVQTITNNQVYNITSNNPSTGTLANSVAAGIVVSNTSHSGHNISGNTVYNIINQSNGAVNVQGILVNSSTTTANTINANLVHSLLATSTVSTTTINGISLIAGNHNVSNNMIRLGLREDGTTTAGAAAVIYGINEAAGANNIYHNSVYIGGTFANTVNSFALFSAVASGTRNVMNNIFVNARVNSSTGRNYAIRFASTTGLNSNYNDLFVTGTGTLLGQVNTTNYATLTDWQAGALEDANSISADPQFINPAGSAGVDLHIQAAPVNTPIEGTGLDVGISADFDGDDRTAFTPTDMGADAGDFEPIDLTAPAITFTDISGVCNSATSHTFTVNITDASGVNITSGGAPRVYYKKSGDANDLTGWKFVESTTGSSPFSFTIDFSQLNAGSVSAGDVLQYFVVAQDVAPTGANVAMFNGTFTAAPISVDLTSAAFPIGGTIKQFSILPCSGTVTVGTGGNYPSLTNPGGLFEAINATTLSGNLVANITTDLTLETGTHPLNQWAESGVGNYTLTIQADGTTQRLIASTGAATTGLIRITGGDRTTFNGGTGTDRLLVFRNTITNNAGANTFSFSNDATNNTINNCIIEGAPLSTGNGVISFGTGVTTGNDNNTITNCDISDNGTTPYNAIYSVGTGTTAINNSGNNINNCNISDYHHPSGVSTGILLGTGNNSWTIQDNHFFQTASRTAAAGIHSAININNNVANQGGYVITGNYIGGSAADGSGTMTYTSTLAAQYAPIYLPFVPTLPASTVTNNIIDNISVSTVSASTSGPGMFAGIYLGATAASWTVTGNLIGDTTANGSIAVTLGTNSGGFVFGIRSESTGSPNISNNTVGGVSVNATGSNANAYFQGIGFTAGNVTANNNLIGSAAVANSVLVSGTATTNPGNIIGIAGTSSSAYFSTVSNNRVMNLRHSNSGTNTQITGIACSNGGQYSITGNTVRSISTLSGNTGNGTSSSVLGIMLNTGNTLAQTVSQNTVYDLANTGTTASTVTGIFCSPGSNTGNVLSRNFVHSLVPTTSTSASAGVVGISIGGPLTASNNMIRLGIDASGASITTAQPINGISLNNTSGATNVYFNTVYIGGSGVGTGTTGTTVAFRRVSTSGTHNFRNNIFVNARSNASTGSKHYAYLVANNTGVTSDYNLFHAPGTGGVLFSVNNGTSDLTTLAGLQIGGGQNINSGVDDPNLVNPTGDASAVDLHITGITAADEAGIAIAGINVDFDGDDRTSPSTTPTDIGADAVDATPKDIVPPAVSVTSVPAQAPCGGTLTVNITATVTDATSGVNTTTFPPTLWWRESTGTWASLAATSNTGNDWLFTLNLTGVTAGQTYQYYAAAQDLATTPNVGYSNFSATTPVHADPLSTPSVTNTSPASFNIISVSPLSGTVTVGTGGDFTSFNANSSTGLFFSLMTRGLDGDLIVEVISDINEAGLYYVLGEIPEYCGTGYTVTIRPNAATVRTIFQATGGNPMINFQGTKRIYIDGSFGGSGKYLTFAGRQNMPTFYFNGATQNVSIQNCNIEGNNTLTNSVGPGVINFAGLLGTGSGIMRDIVIDNNIIRNRSDITQVSTSSPNILINIGGSSATSNPVKRNITISNNELFNFRESAIQIRQNSSFNGIGDSIMIMGNKVYEVISYPTYQYPIWLEGGSNSKGHVISNNFIGGNAAPTTTLTGTWENLKTDGEIVAIYTLNGGSDINDGITISDNVIGNMYIAGTSYSNFIGIRNESGYAKIMNNTINNVLNNGSGDPLDITANSANIGIWSQDYNEVLIEGNIISNITADYITGIVPYQFVVGICHGSNFYLNGIDYTNDPGGKAVIRNNQIFNLNSGSILASLLISPDALIGIFNFSANGTTGNEISGNEVYSLNVTEAWTNTSANTRLYGIGIGLGGYGSTQTGAIFNNKVYDLNNNSRANAPEVNGIITGGGNWTVSNNMVSLSNSDYTVASPLMVGLLDWMASGRTGAFYNNTVYISGTVSSGSNTSYAYCRIPDGTASGDGANVTLRNNILFNNRTGNSTNNIAIGNLNLGNPAIGWNSDYNFLLTRNTAQVGRWAGGSGGDRTFANWQTTSSGDANSLTATITSGTSSASTTNPAELFLDAAIGDLRISIAPPNSPYPYDFVLNRGVTLSAVTTDFEGDSRPLGTAYDIGADEFTACATPVISANPTNPAAICEGANTSVTVTATGSGLSYQWEVSTNSGSSWGNATGGVYTNATTATLNITGATASMNNYQYRVVVTNSCGNTTSTAATLTINTAPTAVTVSGGGTYCGTAELTASGGIGGTIYWQGTTSGGTSTSNTSTSQTVSSSGTYYFRSRSSAGCWGAEGSATVTILTAPNTATVWTGDVDNDWFKWNNWTNCVPGSITDVTIPAGRPNYPAVYGSNPVANSVTIETGASMTLNGGRTLVNTTYINNAGTLTMTGASTIQLGTDWTNTGIFSSGNGTVEFTGSANSTVNAGGTGTNHAFNNVLVTKATNAKVTLAASVKTNGNLQVNTGEFEVPAGLQALPNNVINNPSGTIRVKGAGQLRVEP